MGSSIIVLVLRIVQFIFAAIVLALSGYVASWYYNDTLTASPPQVNFMIWSPIFAVLALIYLEPVARMRPQWSNPIVGLGLEFLNMLFWFAGFIALAVFLQSLVFCRGSVCAAARTSTAFGAFSFVAWTASFVLMAMDVIPRVLRRTSPVSQMKETA